MTVHLVGAGPGDPELITVRAARLLGTADIVLHDRLIDPAILDLVSPHATVIDVGKGQGEAMTQDHINDLLVRFGRHRLDVVRLKGGDPFVFGRGGEEAIALAEAGIPFDVVPGVTSSIAAPAYAGVPVTHRGVSAAFTVVAGQRGAGNPPIDWQALARVGGTIVVLMGVAHRAEIAADLVAGGLAADTPVCSITWGTHRHQQVLRTTLESLGTADIHNPATIVIGAVAALDLSWAPNVEAFEAAAASAR